MESLKNKAVLLIGLPGSGKTSLAFEKYLPKGYILIDDPSKHHVNFMSMMIYLKLSKHDLVITDPLLCNEPNRIKAIELMELNNYDVECVYFENDEEKCMNLIKLRNDGKNIKTFKSFNYTIPPNVTPIPIHVPENKD